MPLNRTVLTAELMLLTATLFWGLSFPLMKHALTMLPPLALIGWRFVAALLILLPWTWAGLRHSGKQTASHGMVLGALMFMAFWLVILGLSSTTATNTGFLSALFILWVPLLSRFYLGVRLHISTLLAMLLGLAGVAVLSDWHRLTLHWGDIWVIIGSVFTAVHILLLSLWSPQHPTRVLTLWQIATVAVLSLAASAVWEPKTLPELGQSQLLGIIALTGLLSTAFAIWAQTTFQVRTSAERATLIYNLEPVFAAVFAMWLLQERLSPNILLGGGLIVAAMMLSGLWPAGARKKAA